jgi:nucleoside-diphosphate-sugar epimerase
LSVTQHEFGALQGATALVTGGAGFIGSALSARLTTLGVAVHSVSRRTNGPAGAQRHWSVDLSDSSAVEKLIGTLRPDYVFHLASHVWGAPDLKHFLPAFHSNLQTSVNLFHALAQTGGSKCVITTGSLVEPDVGSGQTIPNSPYAAAKWASASYARMCHALYGLPVAIARVFMVYGPAQQDEGKLVPYVIRCLQQGETPKISSGRHVYDWVFVDDVVDGFLKMSVAENIGGQSVDLGTGLQIRTADLVNTLCELMGAKERPEYGALTDRPFEPVRVADTSRAYAQIGYRPQVALREGLQRTIDWYNAHPIATAKETTNA